MDDNNDKIMNIEYQSVLVESDFFTVDRDTDKNIELLEKNSTFEISGLFKPKMAGSYVLEATLQYNEGDPVKAVTQIIVKEPQSLQLLNILQLPEEVVAESLHKIELMINNINEAPVTIETISAGISVADNLKITYKNKTYSLESFNNLPEKEKYFPKNQVIKIVGYYKARSKPGPDSLGVIVNYRNESSARFEESFDNITGSKTTVIAKEEAKVILTAKVEPEKKQMKINGEEKIVFTFENKSSKYPATGVVITIKNTETQREEIKKN